MEALLSELHTQLLECKVCMETFSFSADDRPDRRPMILSCGHVLCVECVRLLPAPLHDKHALLCPFCRLPGDRTRLSLCRPISHLQELLLEQESSASLSSLAPPPAVTRWRGLEHGALRLACAFGGWGTLMNPTGVAVFRSGAIAVVHDGKERVRVFGPQGRSLRAFGPRVGGASGDLVYPLGVAALPCGQVVVSDAGDSALKLLTGRGQAVVEAREWLLPWGVCVSGDGAVLAVDSQRGALERLEVEGSSNGGFRGRRVLLQGLQNPQGIACCTHSGHIAVVEHTHTHTHTLPGHTVLLKHRDTSSTAHTHTRTHTRVMSTRLKLYSSDLTLLRQIDSLSLGLHTGSPTPQLCLTAVTFDPAGNLVAADAGTGTVWSLGRPWEDGRVALVPLVRDGLVRPLGLAISGDTLVVLDGGDHSVKMYSCHTD